MNCRIEPKEDHFELYLPATTIEEQDKLLILHNDSLSENPILTPRSGIGKWATDIDSIDPAHSIKTIRIVLGKHIRKKDPKPSR